MDMLGRPYEYENPTASDVLGARDLRNESMVYYGNAPSSTLRGAKGVKVESDLPLFWCP